MQVGELVLILIKNDNVHFVSVYSRIRLLGLIVLYSLSYSEMDDAEQINIRSRALTLNFAIWIFTKIKIFRMNIRQPLIFEPVNGHYFL